MDLLPSDFNVSETDQQRLLEFCRSYRDLKNHVVSTGLVHGGNGSSDGTRFDSEPLPQITRVTVQINRALLVEFAQGLNDLLAEHISDKFHNIIGISEYEGDRESGLAELVQRVISGDGAYLSYLSRFQDIPIDRIAFFAVYLSRPFRQVVSNRIPGSWGLGYCPTCGLWPRMAHVHSESGSRSLWCIGCESVWSYVRLECPFCLESNQEKLGYLKLASTDKYRLYTCDSCRRYLKATVANSNPVSREVELDEQYLLTFGLDTTASFENYFQDFVGFAAFDLQDSPALRRYVAKAKNLL